MKILYIIRGLPGVGKTTLAKELTGTVYAEADQYFTDESGNYNYDRTKISEAHVACQTAISNYISAQYDRIAVSNTFSERWEMVPYLDMANKYGYTVIEITLTGKPFANVHGVSDETIAMMRDRWEK